MTIRNLFSKRKAIEARAGKPDVYQYAELPSAFRVQVVHIWKRAIGDYPSPTSRWGAGPTPKLWDMIERTVAEEHGLFHLGDDWGPSAFNRCVTYFMALKNTDKALDVIEASFGAMDEHIREDIPQRAAAYIQQWPDDAISDLNQRFREHGIGYHYESGLIVRVDSQYIHAEAVLPALSLLREHGFEGPEDEFLRAHKHYREGNSKEAVNEALKALESTLKAICDARGWAYDKDKATAKPLIDIVLREGLIPTFLETGFSGLRSVLENFVPTTRNRTSGHGQGSVPTDVPGHVAAYVLHVTAASIVLLVEAHKAKH